MTRVFELEIITPTGVVYDDTAEALVAQGVDGAFGILARHAPLLAALRPGKLKVRKSNQRALYFDCGTGILEVRRDRVTVLADQCSLLDHAHAPAL
ncbi:MAG: ATP synthase F1 subunit epsilon [Kiritimatiellia bacterium]|jgi:F-type H+-transporting ATPase subunit epsilon